MATNLTIAKLLKSQVKLTVEIPTNEVQPFLDAAAKELSKKHPLKGFRPGAAPFDVLRSHLGDAALVEEALQQLVPKTYVDALLEHDELEAIGRPDVRALQIEIGKPWIYEATVAVLPEVTLGNYKEIRSEKKDIVIDPQEVEKELEHLQKLRATFLSVVRPAQMGDRVKADVNAAIGNVPLENGAAPDQSILLGEGYLVPGFEEQLVGMAEGGIKTFPISFPDTHHQVELRGKTVDFTVKLHQIEQRILPELNNDFAKSLGTFETIDMVKAKLTENMTEEKRQKETERRQLDLLEQVVKGASFEEFPDALVQNEVQKMLAELEQGLQSSGLNMEQYLQSIQKTPEQVIEGFRPQALDRIRSGLALRALAKYEDVRIEDADIEVEANKVLQQFPSMEEAKKHLDVEELMNVASGTLRNRKVFALLEAFADKNV